MMRRSLVVLLVGVTACVEVPRLEAGAAVVVLDAGVDGGEGLDGGAPRLDAGVVTAHPPLPDGVSLQHDVFATGRVCGDCHSASATSSANRDEQNRPVDLFEWWSASAMGNSARDPLFRAVLASEQARAPAAAEAISTVCLTCHAPMAKLALSHAGTLPATLTNTVYADGPVGALARDGISCTLCHQVQPANFGLEASFSGGFELDSSRRIYGPYSAPFANPMVARSGFTPTEGRHVQESALCGTCHVLATEALTEAGQATGHTMGEQLTYLEWRRSAFTTEGGGTSPASCQDCHMPDGRDDGQPLSTRLARRPEGSDFPQVASRAPFSRHGFSGGNTVLPRLLRSGRVLLRPVASDASLEAAEARNAELLRRRTAKVTLSNVTRVGGVGHVTVKVENLAGHKLPSGYPSRRLFLEVQVLDGAGQRQSAAGVVDAQGRLLGADGRPLPGELVGGPTQPHRDLVSGADSPAVWESVMQDDHGQPSFSLLAAAGYLKDNRLLPRGHVDSSTGPRSTAPVGVSDPNFVAGGDTVEVSLPAPLTGRLEVRLHYQSFSPRFLEEQLGRPTPEGAALRSMLTTGMLKPELVDEVIVPLP